MGPETRKKAAIDGAARKIWDYMRLGQHVERSDMILALGCSDEYVARHSASLYLAGYGDFVLVSGGVVHAYEAWQGVTEAEHFAGIMMQDGLPESRVMLEKESINTGENLAFSYKLLEDRGVKPQSMIVVNKPHVERRVFAALKKQWPETETRIQVTSPPFSYDSYLGAHEVLSERQIIGSIASNLRKIREYPELGYQIEQVIPNEVWQAYEFLAAQGYD